MKRFTACYYVSIDVEVPDEEFDKVMSLKNDKPDRKNLELGEAFNSLVEKYATKEWFKLPAGSEIYGVYNPSTLVKTTDAQGAVEYSAKFAQPEDDEVYWEP